MFLLEKLRLARQLFNQVLRENARPPLSLDEFIEDGFVVNDFGKVVGSYGGEDVSIDVESSSVYLEGLLMQLQTVRLCQ